VISTVGPISAAGICISSPLVSQMKLGEVVSKLKSEIQSQENGSDSSVEVLQVSLAASSKETNELKLGRSNEENCPPVGLAIGSSNVKAFGVKVNGTSQWKLMRSLASEGHVSEKA